VKNGPHRDFACGRGPRPHNLPQRLGPFPPPGGPPHWPYRGLHGLPKNYLPYRPGPRKKLWLGGTPNRAHRTLIRCQTSPPGLAPPPGPGWFPKVAPPARPATAPPRTPWVLLATGSEKSRWTAGAPGALLRAPPPFFFFFFFLGGGKKKTGVVGLTPSTPRSAREMKRRGFPPPPLSDPGPPGGPPFWGRRRWGLPWPPPCEPRPLGPREGCRPWVFEGGADHRCCPPKSPKGPLWDALPNEMELRPLRAQSRP